MIWTVCRALGRRFDPLLAVVFICVGVLADHRSPPPNAQRFAPPAIYARWWGMTDACSGACGDFSAVSWYHVPGYGFKSDGQLVSGLWESRDNRIVIADTSLDDGSVVRHEMLHALVRGGGHPRAQFLGGCAALVACAEPHVARGHGRPAGTVDGPPSFPH